jgi:hypothetical protein
MTAAGEVRLLTSRRRTGREIAIDNEMIHIRDQAPLHEGNIRFTDSIRTSRVRLPTLAL